VEGGWLQQNAPEGAQQLQDIAFSGNGEPTSAAEFPQAIALVGQILQEMNLTRLKIRLITNGSLMQRSAVQDAVASMAALNGEVWFKVDRATVDGIANVNLVNDNPAAVKRRLLACAERCPTWIQTCWFALDGVAPDETELAAYVDFVQQVRDSIAGVHLYGLARQPMQPGAERLSPVAETVLQAYAERIRQLGVVVNVSV
jgi:wyosine [tRNA(Phe)-imidazoG37] synthetase (radical SAM superfamily)